MFWLNQSYLLIVFLIICSRIISHSPFPSCLKAVTKKTLKYKTAIWSLHFLFEFQNHFYIYYIIWPLLQLCLIPKYVTFLFCKMKSRGCKTYSLRNVVLKTRSSMQPVFDLPPKQITQLAYNSNTKLPINKKALSWHTSSHLHPI